ncbi:MAG: pyrimidine dimer DNA glycosylase/endonuclease V [Candidatus Thermoplasmatota archaeon]|nr:pyrimidine dimer DNA glycosylase/endonuclease V [Candidatus Thermoplasmatota archaeon]
MRIWDISTKKLCNRHLLGEHSELHAIWSIITKDKKGFANHPETTRWQGKLKALYLRHEKIVQEMKKRGFYHKSPLNGDFAIGQSVQKDLIDSIEDQISLLRSKKCKCKV